ncbi:uncharacterized protein LOC143281103 isoform X2 [Babylonia areolata]|uniref:uncharacterized protein LOC143281103 isoform X2 n=1 Tax=Babylonia areolata TaxID=304850 RepID=UPI003FD151C7
MEGWVLYERGKERIVVRPSPAHVVRGRKWRSSPRPEARQTKVGAGWHRTERADPPVLGVPPFCPALTDGVHLCPVSHYQAHHHTDLGHCLPCQNACHISLCQDAAYPAIHQTCLQQKWTCSGDGLSDFGRHSPVSDSRQTKDLVQHDADEDWPVLYIPRCLESGNVWKLCWEDDQADRPLSPISEEGQLSVGDRDPSPVREEGCQCATIAQCPPEHEQPSRALSPILEEGDDLVSSVLYDENVEDTSRPLSPILEDDVTVYTLQCHDVEYTRPLSPILEEDMTITTELCLDDVKNTRPMSPMEDDMTVTTTKCHDDVEDTRLLSPTLEDDMTVTTTLCHEDIEDTRSLSPILEDDMTATTALCHEVIEDTRLLSPILENDMTITTALCHEDIEDTRSLPSILEEDTTNTTCLDTEDTRSLSPILEDDQTVTSAHCHEDVEDVLEDDQFVSRALRHEDVEGILEHDLFVSRELRQEDVEEILEHDHFVTTALCHEDVEDILEDAQFVTTAFCHEGVEDILEDAQFVTTALCHEDVEDILEDAQFVTTALCHEDVEDILEDAQFTTALCHEDVEDILEDAQFVTTALCHEDVEDILEDDQFVTTALCHEDVEDILEDDQFVTTALCHEDAEDILEDDQFVTTTLCHEDVEDILEDDQFTTALCYEDVEDTTPLSPALEGDQFVTKAQSHQDVEETSSPEPAWEQFATTAAQSDQEDEESKRPLLPSSETERQTVTVEQCSQKTPENEHVHADNDERVDMEETSPGSQQSFTRASSDEAEGDCDDAGGGGGEGKPPAIHAWYLVDPGGKQLRLPRTMLFLGRDECDIIIQSDTVDKRHAVITFDLYLSRFKVKDLSTTNGTYVNESRIPEQEYVTLNHMDTIRLGYDSKVYHMEQGELCGDTPPPQTPPLPLSLHHSSPPRSPSSASPQHHVSGKGIMEAEASTWECGHDDPPMAECQGCIAEQRIEHTCTHASASPRPHHHHHHHHHHAPGEQDKFVEVQRKRPDPREVEVEVEEDFERHQHQQQQERETCPELPLEADPQQKSRPGRNTWPRKKVKQARRAASDLFDDNVDGGDDDEELVVESGSNYFVSADDWAVCGGDEGAGRGGRMVVEYSLSRTGSVHRIPRNSKHPLPPELETVKKGTPLYGQPSWWGEDMDPGDKEGMEHPQQRKPEAKSPRPSSLAMMQGLAKAAHPHPHPHPPQHAKDSKPVYMEIPHRTTTPERDKPPSSGPRDKTTPARSLTSSSLSKDSLVLSPDSVRGRSVDKESDPGGKAAGVGTGAAATEVCGNPGLSFTVEFGDEKKPKLKNGASLSQFVPSKLRHSLSSHTPHTRSSDKASSRGKDSDSSCKNSEERELSPVTAVKQKRVEEACGGGGSEAVSKGKSGSARRSSGQGTGAGSLRSADFASDTTPTSATKNRREGEKRPREAEKEADKKPPKPQEPRKSTSRAPATTKGSSSSKPKPQPSAAAIAASVQAAQYSDPTAYLIDRMFAGATDSPRSECSDLERSDSPAAPEHAMYKEARDYDRASHRGGGSGSATHRPSGKAVVQRQKSASKSPATTTTTTSNNKNSVPMNNKSPSTTTNRKSPGGGTGTPRSPRATASPKSPGGKAGKQPRPVKGKSAEPEGPGAAVAPPAAPQSLPVAPSPVGVGDQEDKVSEAGTYTIEAEEDGEEELMARQQIDEIFGVVEVNSFSFERPIIGTRGRPLRSSEEEEEDEGEEKTLHEDEGASMEPGCHTPSEEDTENVFDQEVEEEEEEGLMSRSMGEEEVPSWVSQLNSLTSGARHSPASPKDAGRKEGAARDEASKKPPQGLSRKRPGTGRKLPSIPTGNDQSPVSSDHSSHHQASSPDTGHNGAGPRLNNGQDCSADDSPSRNVKFSPVVSSGSGVFGVSRAETSPCGSEESGNRNSGATPEGCSVRSRGSIDTELLLRDTETVMAAMEARMGFRRDDGGGGEEEEEGVGSDTDLTSTVAMVNGDEDYVKPTKYHSPRDTMSGKVSKEKDNSNIRIASVSSSSRKTMARSFSEQKPPLKSDRSARSGAGVSVVSDVFSRSNSLDQSFPSDASDAGSSDRTETSFSRSGSRGKGTITMTKPNRAFALRRARADGSEMADTARSRASAASAATTASSRRSSSIHGTPRTSYTDRTATEASLGAQIARKAKENTATPKARESSGTRQDVSQRSSLRLTDRRSSASSSASSTISSAKKERDIRTLKSQLKSAPGSKDLAITGVSSRSHSQPGSRSNSPKAAERLAWKRRKEYDPRKAVAEARANKAKESRPKPKVQSSSLYKQRMTRSASFTNSAELSGRVRHDTYNVDSTSSVDDLSSATTASDAYGETGFRRAFIPFHNPLRSDRLSLSHSADEDEAGPFPTSQSYDSLIVSSIYQLSLKLKTNMDKALLKLREQDRASITPSPIDDFLGHPAKSEIPAWKSANQELAGVLKNLRKMEHHLHLMVRALFPEEDTDTDISGMSSSEKHKYFQEIERIRSELAGFQPIDSPHSQAMDPGSPEMAELTKDVR